MAIIALLLQYKYFVIFPFSVIEGPILTVIAGFLVAGGSLNAFIVYPLVLCGDVIGDAACYAIGRWGSGLVRRYGSKIGVTPEKIAQARAYFETHRKKALFFSKMLHGIGFTGLIVAGTLRIPYRKFFTVCFITSAIQSLILLIVGILFGNAYALIGQYLNYYAAGSIVVVVFVIGFFVSRKFGVLIKRD